MLEYYHEKMVYIYTWVTMNEDKLIFTTTLLEYWSISKNLLRGFKLELQFAQDVSYYV